MKLISLILSFFVSLVSFGQNNSLLYKIESPNSKPSYLFGTMHVIPDSAYYFPVKIQKILKHSDKLVMEVADLDMLKAQKLLTLSEGSCFDIFTPAQKDSVVEWGSKSLGVNEETFVSAFESLKPFTLMQLGTKDMMSGDVKYIEMELQKMAPELPKGGFETLEDQIGFFDSLPKSVMAEMIMQMVRDEKNNDDQMMSSLIKAYMEKDLDKLSELVKQEEDQTGTNAILLDDRNARWIPKIQEFIKTQSCFIAVGAAHLGGENGVIALLKKQGYTVTPIPY